MQTKMIRFSSGQVVELNFEEVREQFKPMVFKALKTANNKFVYNQVEEDDFRQELELELWRAFIDYDPETGNCFSTYLHYKLMKGVRNTTYSRYSLKNQHNGLVSMNAPRGDDDLKLEDMFASEDDSMDNIVVNELKMIIEENVTEEEADLLSIILDRKNYSVVDYAIRTGITRQAANQRVKKLQRKLQDLISRNYLEIA